MTDEPTVDPTPPFLAHVKRVTMERIISHMNGVGAVVVQSYPMAEVQSWPVQKPEAEAALVFGETAFLAQSAEELSALTPFLLSVAEVQHGAAEFEERLAQVWAKALAVKANAENWARLSAYVNGLRARAQDRVDAAESEVEVYTIESETATELEAFRSAAGI